MILHFQYLLYLKLHRYLISNIFENDKANHDFIHLQFSLVIWSIINFFENSTSFFQVT